MTLEDYIFKSIYEYPSLYYARAFEESRRRVLEHVFVTLGNGVKFAYTENPEDGGYFCSSKSKKVKEKWERQYDKPYGQVKCSKKIRKKILAGERIIEIRNVDKERSKKIGKIFPKNDYGRNREKNEFWESDIKEVYQKAYTTLNKDGEILDKCHLRTSPPDADDNYESFCEKERHPYPFCFYYLNFVEINPHYKKYDYHTIKNMTVEELRESKALIRPDWVAGIVEIYKWALEFFENDEKFFGDNYYNWIDDKNNKFEEEFNKEFQAAKLDNTFADFCKKYGLDDYDYETPYEMNMARILQIRSNYISDCKKIIAAFED